MRKKKLLYLIESSETGGAEKIFLSLVETIDKEKNELHVGLFYKGWLYDELVKRGIVPVVFVNKKGGYDFFLLFNLLRFIRRNKIDLVCSHLFSANLYSGVVGKILGVPVIGVFHGTMDVSSNDKSARIKFFILNFCLTRIVYVSKSLKDFFIEKFHVDKKKSLIIYNGVDLWCQYDVVKRDLARKEIGVSIDDFLVIAIGDIRPAKDYPNLLKAISRAVKKIPNMQLVIAGSLTSIASELEQLIKQYGLTRCVKLLGYRQDVRNILPCCNLYVSSSLSEGFSLTVVEAMAARIPVVATRSGGPDEIVQHRITGFLVDPGAPHQLADAMVEMYKDRAFSETLAENGVGVVEQKFSLDQMTRKYDELITNVIGI